MGYRRAATFQRRIGQSPDWINNAQYSLGGDLVVVGQTGSTDFPNTVGQTKPAGANAFAAKYVRTTREPGNISYTLDEVWILGGAGADTAVDIRIGPDGIYYVGGNTGSTSFPMTSFPPGNHSWVARIGPLTPAALSSGDVGQGTSPSGDAGLLNVAGFPSSDFSGFTGPPYSGANHSMHDHDGDGDHDICFHGQTSPSDLNRFNNITILDGTTLTRVSEWHVLRQVASQGVNISRSIFDPEANEICFTGSSTGNLVGAPHPGNPQTWKQFIGKIPLDTLPPGGGPVPVSDLFFIDDGTPPGTHVFPEGLQTLPGPNGAMRVFSGGTWQAQNGSAESFVWEAPLEQGASRLVVDRNTGFIRTIPNSNLLDLQIGNTLNLHAAGHVFAGPDARDLAIWQIDSGTGAILDSLTIPGSGRFNFAAGGALWPDGSHYTLVSGAGGMSLTTTPGAPQPNYPGGSTSGYIAQTESFDLNPLAIVTGGKFAPAPLVPYGFYTIFIDWQRIPGLIVPGLEDNRFLKSAAGLEVLVNGEPTATTAATPGQVNFIAHNNVDDNDTATVQLRYMEVGGSDVFLSNVVEMPTAPSWPNPFEINGVGAATHSQGILSQQNPLHQDDGLTLYFAGGGAFGEDSIEADELTPVEIFFFDNTPTVEAILQDSRFAVQVGFAGPSPGSTPALGQLNLTFSQAFWTFACAQTNVEFTLRVTDTQAGSRVYQDALGRPFEPILDTQAFATCP